MENKDTPVSFFILVAIFDISQLIWLAQDEFSFLRFWTRDFSDTIEI